MLRGQRVPLAANFTAGYGVWLARANFNRQSLRSLLGREGGIDRPHVYLMQPYDPNRRIIVMLHGLASSPEAWVELANEILGDEALRQHYQIWQVYYPTNMPVALNHAMIRRALGDTLTHFDPSGQAPASSDLVLVGHSMGGVIARLMVSSTDQSLVQLAADHSRLTPQQIRRIDPMLRFEPFPNVSSAIFIAAPHRGTSVAGGRLGRWMAGFIRFPITVLEELAHTLAPNAAASSRESLATIPNSVNNLDENDPFVRTAAAKFISSLGIQMLMAAPSEAKSKFLGFTDTVYELDRFNENLFFHREVLTEKAHELMRSDMPSEHPELLDAKMAEHSQHATDSQTSS